MEVAVACAASYNGGKMPKTRTKTAALSFRVTEATAETLAACARAMGLSQVAVLEIAIRAYARRQDVRDALAAQAKEGE